ncbi:MAG: type II secretion system protein [Armatimonadota bacterium]|nr:type II secretion system protein [Armatimonadota bacterium]MDR7520154.1 type II secretion system protein [Armatimonadota bacterium]MDR7551044.1 type II secretion system protein [Armatimonadota bacterium]
MGAAQDLGWSQAPRPRDGAGFTYLELLVALSIFAAVSLLILQTFIVGMAHAGRANERAAATTIALQIMEQIRASANPYTWVNSGPMARTGLPLPFPYSGVTNPSPHTFQVAVDFVQDDNLTITTATVRVYRPADPDAAPLVSLTTVLDDQ